MVQTVYVLWKCTEEAESGDCQTQDIDQITKNDPENDLLSIDEKRKPKVSRKQKNRERRELGLTYTGRHFDKENKRFVEVTKEEKKLNERCHCKAT